MVRVTVLIVGLGLVWLFGWLGLSNAFLASQRPGRLIIASLRVLPPAILMGIPFPMGLWFVGQLFCNIRPSYVIPPFGPPSARQPHRRGGPGS